MATKTHKRAKSSRYKGSGTAGWGFRKKHKKSGHRGGKGMAGTGKRADQRKTLVLKLYGNDYFGKQGVTSRGTEKDKRKRINLKTIELNLDNYLKKGIAKKTKDGVEINLEGYKILGDGEIKEKLIIKAEEASENAISKIEKAGGKIFLSQKSKENKQQTRAIEKTEGKVQTQEKEKKAKKENKK
ncbi:MAG: uL15 family ribosomal protein [Nanoarchaeota archaeon]|nr:uL15 family ribosomal protein [Nanoarchaeota archaeon]